MGKIIYISYVDGIDMNKCNAIIAILTELIRTEKPDTFYFLISSNGGSVDAGIALYNFLKAIPQKIVMHNIGSIDSIANVIFVSGDERYAAPHSTFLFHGVTWGIPEPTVLTLPMINEITDRIEKNHDTIAGIVCASSKIKEKDLKTLFNEGENKSANFALENGIISAIKLPQIPSDAPIVSLNFNL